jgi:hypothetical protein
MNHEAGSKLTNSRRRFTFTIWHLMKIVFGVACCFGLLAALGRLEAPARYGARRAQCTNNLKQIALAMHNYQSVYGTFPSAYVADRQGRPMHSWRVLILPFLEFQSLYDRYSFNEPWDGPNNIKLLNEMPQLFECPSHHATGPVPSTLTSYVVIRGPGTMFPGSKSVRLDQVTDGPDRTIMAVETANMHIPWTKPEDLDLDTMSLQINDRDQPSFSSDHQGGAQAAFGDGMCRFLANSTPGIGLRALVTIAGRETIPQDW